MLMTKIRNKLLDDLADMREIVILYFSAMMASTR